MKKVIFVLLFIILSLSIVSCNYKKESTLKEENTTERILIKPTTAETTGTTITHNTAYPEKTATNKDTTTKITENGNLLQTRVIGEYINGYHLRPNIISKKGVVITFGGSEASSNIHLAKRIATEGYEVYSMYFFGQENQKEAIANVPLDFFEELYTEIENNSERNRPLTVIGASRGAELTLILASKYQDLIDNIVLYAPSAYAFGGVTDDTGKEFSPWTYKGEALAFLKQSDLFRDEAGRSIVKNASIKTPMVLEPIFSYLIEEGENAEQAMIDISSVKANILLFAGKDDQMWPSYKMGQIIVEKHQGNNELVAYDNVGHSFYGPTEYNDMAMGGEYEKNAEAGKDSDKKLLETLEEWMK